jgi:hypothetical protein
VKSRPLAEERLPNESLRGYARRLGISYRQARKLLTGRVYEREHASRSFRRQTRNTFWLARWREQNPDERRSDAAVLRSWRAAGYQLPRRGSHGTHALSTRERAHVVAFLSALGMTTESANHYLDARGVETRHGRRNPSDPRVDVEEAA